MPFNDYLDLLNGKRSMSNIDKFIKISSSMCIIC